MIGVAMLIPNKALKLATTAGADNMIVSPGGYQHKAGQYMLQGF